MHEKPTSFDIAYLAGVSQPTVSRALRGSPMVSLETRKRTDDSQINPFFLSMLGSLTRASARQGYDLLISFQQFSKDWQQDYEDSRKADGIILLGYGDYEEYRPRLVRLVEQGTHFVRWGPVLEGQPGVSVGCDNLQGGYDVTRHLLGTGRRSIAFLGNASTHYPEFFDRYRGYERALMEARVATSSALQVDAITTEESGFQAASELLRRGAKFDAIVAASDLIAIGALRALADAGLEVPRQVAVSGFDDIPSASLTHPPLTTVMQDTRRAGELLVESLLRQIAGDPVSNSVIPTKLVIRKSA
jgi:DNA-binding LacI/PurR family transcriptional regulator